jgi:5'-nucleotidase
MQHLRWEVLALVVVLASALAILSGGKVHAQPVDYWLTIFHNNDGESDLLPDGDAGGAARYITRLNELRGEVDPAWGQLTLSSGDNFLAGPVFNAGLEQGVPFYDTIIMDLIGYDAVCLGNHDFDFGPDVLADFISGYTTPVPYLSSNLDFGAEPGLQFFVDAGVLMASTVVETGGEQIGIIGATTEALRFISSPRDVVVNEVLPAVQAEIDALTLAGVDKIILISHLQSVLEDTDLAAQLSGLDVMIAGGGDELLANAGDLLIPGDEGTVYGTYPLYATDADGNEIPVVTTSGQYRYIGKLEIGFDAAGDVVAIGDGSGPVRVVQGDFPDAVEPDPTAQAQVIDPVAAALEALNENVVAVSEVDLDGIREHVRTEETNEGDLCADALLWNARRLAGDYGVPEADVSLQNGGGIRNDEIVPAGPITELKTFEMLPFANFLTVVENVSREQFKEILENCVSRVEFVDGRFGQVAGCRFLYDIGGTPQELDDDLNVVTPGTRVVEVVLDSGVVLVNGGEVVPGPDVTVATINFLAGGGDQYPFRDAPFTLLGLSYQQTLQTYLEDGLGGLIAAADYPEGGEGRILTEGTVDIVDDGSDEAEQDSTPVAFTALRQNYPNPFNPMTTIVFDLPRSERVHVGVYDVAGRLVTTLVNDVRDAGSHSVVWTGRDEAGNPVPSGTYFYRMDTGSTSRTRTMVLLK